MDARPLGTLGLFVALAACAYGGDPPTRDVEIADGAIALDLSDGWHRSSVAVDPPVVMVAEGPGEAEQLVVSLQDGEDTAEQTAVRTVVGYVERGLVDCRRLEDTEIWDGPVFDCPDHTRRPWVHKVLVPIPGDGVSAVVAVQAQAGTLDDMADVVRPVLDSFVWVDD